MIAVPRCSPARASASAVTVKKRTEAPGLPPQIWGGAGAFCAIKIWHPAVAECSREKEGDVTFRTLTLKDGGKIKEKLTETGDLPIPMRSSRAPSPSRTTRQSSGSRSTTSRTVRCSIGKPISTPREVDDDAKKLIADIFAAGLKGIKQQAIVASDAREGKTTAPGDDQDDDNGD